MSKSNQSVFHHCRLKAFARNKVLFNMNGTILKPSNDITVRMRFFKKASGYKPWFFDDYFDVCQYLRKRSLPIANVVYRLFKPYTNINHSCPYEGPQIIKGFYLRPDLMRLPIPTGDYMLSIQWHFEKKLTFDTNLSFTFSEDLLKD